MKAIVAEGVQPEFSEYKEQIRWKNAVIWSGLPDEEAPCEPTP